MDRITHIVEDVVDDPLFNMNYHEWEVTIHMVHDQKLIGHVRYRQQPNEGVLSQQMDYNMSVLRSW
jgi:hypothetical protein